MNFLLTKAARADLRRIGREQALKILLAITRFAKTGEGDVKQLKGSKDFPLDQALRNKVRQVRVYDEAL